MERGEKVCGSLIVVAQHDDYDDGFPSNHRMETTEWSGWVLVSDDDDW